MSEGLSPAGSDAAAPRTAYAVLAAVSLSHLLNDTIQSLLPAIYPILKVSFGLSFRQVGLMTLALMLTASVLQPVVGLIADRRPAPLALVVGMSFTLAGLLVLSVAWSYPVLARPRSRTASRSTACGGSLQRVSRPGVPHVRFSMYFWAPMSSKRASA